MAQVKAKSSQEMAEPISNLAIKTPGHIKVQRNEEQTLAEEGKIFPLLHRTAPLNNWGAVILSKLYIHRGFLCCVFI